MHIKQWLQEPLQKRQCEIIISQTLWELKTVEKNVDFYQQLLDYKFDEELEFRFFNAYKH